MHGFRLKVASQLHGSLCLRAPQANRPTNRRTSHRAPRRKKVPLQIGCSVAETGQNSKWKMDDNEEGDDVDDYSDDVVKPSLGRRPKFIGQVRTGRAISAEVPGLVQNDVQSISHGGSSRNGPFFCRG